MLVLRALVTQGEIPLLGPPTSIGTFHHGAVYYYLAPPALVFGADPVAVTGEIALFGIGDRRRGVVAGRAWSGGGSRPSRPGSSPPVSPAGIDESTFIWNPNLVPLAAASRGSALVAWRSGRARWWLLAGLGAMLTMQLPRAGRRRSCRRSSSPGSRTSGAAARRAPAPAALLAGRRVWRSSPLGSLPLVIHELTADFSETRAIVAYLTGGGPGGGPDIVSTRVHRGAALGDLAASPAS